VHLRQEAKRVTYTENVSLLYGSFASKLVGLKAFVFDLEVCTSRYTFLFFVLLSVAGPCHNFGFQSAVFHSISVGLIQNKSIWNLWWAEWRGEPFSHGIWGFIMSSIQVFIFIFFYRRRYIWV